MKMQARFSPINVAVVGHTNAGKTSLIRTLLRDDRFGEIEETAGTTRYVEKSLVYAGEEAVLNLYDTPGFEDSSALLQALEEMSNTAQAQSRAGQSTSPGMPVELLQNFIAQEDQFPDFEQEIKVLRQAVRSDVLLYIIDVREPLLGKYRDEIDILSKAGKPILPVFNFIAGHAEALARWRQQLAQFNLHAALEFDTVAFDFEAEKRLYQKLQSLLEHHYESLQILIDYRQQVWQSLKQAAARRIFQLLVEVACYRQEVAGGKEEDRAGADHEHVHIMDLVRDAEQGTLQDLLSMFAFTQLDVDLQQLPVTDGQWHLDIFSPRLLKEFGLDAGATALSGAAAGAGLDMMVGGMSLGAATLLGAALGAGLATVRKFQTELSAALLGHKWLCVDDNTVSLLYLRQRKLLHTLTRRGHAAQSKLQLFNDAEHSLPAGWKKLIKVLRQHPEWQQAASTDADYRALQDRVVDWLTNKEY